MILNDTQAAIRDMARQFAQAELWPGAEARDREAREVQEQAERKAALISGQPVVDDPEIEERFMQSRRQLREAAKTARSSTSSSDSSSASAPAGS